MNPYLKEYSNMRAEFKKQPRADFGEFYFKRAFGMIDPQYRNVKDIASKTPREYESMGKLELEFNSIMD